MFRNAKRILIFPGFDTLVQESKGKARDALSQSNEIVTLIEHAEERTREAQNALAGAESDARIARDSAQQAQQHAEQASKVALVETRLVKDQAYMICMLTITSSVVTSGWFVLLLERMLS